MPDIIKDALQWYLGTYELQDWMCGKELDDASAEVWEQESVKYETYMIRVREVADA